MPQSTLKAIPTRPDLQAGWFGEAASMTTSRVDAAYTAARSERFGT